MNFVIPNYISDVLNTLEKSGAEAYIVGGALRDHLMGNVPLDYDIASSFTPNDIKAIFSHTIETGIQHGTVTVVVDGENVEITTFRSEGEYENHRKPKSVTFETDIVKDLSRRDFTINAMAYGKDGLLDPFNGQADIKNKLIRCVGDPNVKFNEDALRMLRAVRFCCKYNFELDISTKDAIKKNAHLLQHISRERICKELTGSVLSPYVEKLSLLYNTGLLKYILPGVNDIYNDTYKNSAVKIGSQTLKTLSLLENNLVLRLFSLLYETKDIAVLKELRFDNKTVSEVKNLFNNKDISINPTKPCVRRVMAAMGENSLLLLLLHRKAYVLTGFLKFQEDYISNLDNLILIYKEIIKENSFIRKNQLAIKGGDIEGLGISNSPKVGELIARLYDAVLETPSLNTKESLISLVKNLLKES